MTLDHLPRLAQLITVIQHLEDRNRHHEAALFAVERDLLIQTMTAPVPAPEPRKGKR